MSTNSLKSIFLAISMLVIAGCPSTSQVKEDTGPPPPRNLLGTTDELQLVTELLTSLTSDHGTEPILVVLAIGDTLLAIDENEPCGAPSAAGASGMPQMVQPDTATQVERMQSTGVKVIAMSAHDPTCSPSIVAELKRYGISFKDSAWPSQNVHVGYEDGVMLTANQDKGKALKALLDESGVPLPDLIIMVDYRQQDLSEVMKAFAFSGTKIHAWRYTRVDTAQN